MKRTILIFLFLVFASGVSFAQTSVSGRRFDVRSFGAKCDGSTNDQTAITAAITAATATGGIVDLPDGTCVVSGLSVPGGVTLRGKGRDVTFIKSTTNAVIVDAVEGSGAFLFYGPEIYDLTIRGTLAAGSSQIGLKVDDTLYIARVNIQGVSINQAGSHGLYVGNAFSSRFVDIYSDNNTGYPFLINSANMPSNHYESLYAQQTTATGNAGFRVLAGNFICISCNGINASAAGSYNAIIGSKVGVDGSVSNIAAFAQWINCNFESAFAGGILHYYNSVSTFSGHNQFAGDGTASGSYKALVYEVTTAIFPPYFAKGRIDASTVFANGTGYYPNEQPIWANDLPPLEIDGQGPKIAGGAFQTTYRNSTNSRNEALYRADGYFPVTAVTTSTSFTNPGNNYYEVTCASDCTLTLPWPGWYQPASQPVIVKNLSTSGVVVTLSANSGGSVNTPNGYTLTQKYQAVTLMPDSTSLDWRVATTIQPNLAQAINVKLDYGCKGDGATNDTTCVAAALAAAVASTGKKLYFPNGTYLVDAGTVTLATNSVIIFGDGPGRSTLKNRTAGAAITLNNAAAITHSITIRDLSLSGFGTGSSDIGLLVTSASNEPFGLTVENVTIGNVAGKGISVTNNLFTSRFVDVDVSVLAAGTNGIDISGGSDIVLENCYVHSVGTGGAAYRIHAGNVAMIGCNGIDSGTTADWLVLGDSTGTGDPSDRYARAILIACNVEAYTNRGVYAKSGSYVSEYRGVTFISATSGTVTAIKYDFVDTGQRGTWDSASSFTLAGSAAYANGKAINSNGAPFVQIGDTTLTDYYDTGSAAVVTLPSLSVQLVPGSTNTAIKTTRAQITALESSGLVGDLTGASSFAGDAARLILQAGTAARPTLASTDVNTTGMYFPSSGTAIGFTVSGTRALTVDSGQSYGVVQNLGNKSGSFTVDFASGSSVTMTAIGNLSTITFSNIKAGGHYVLQITQDGTGGRTWTPPTVFKYPGGIAGNILTGTAGAIDVFICDSLNGTTLVCNGLFDVKNP